MTWGACDFTYAHEPTTACMLFYTTLHKIFLTCQSPQSCYYLQKSFHICYDWQSYYVDHIDTTITYDDQGRSHCGTIAEEERRRRRQALTWCSCMSVGLLNSALGLFKSSVVSRWKRGCACCCSTDRAHAHAASCLQLYFASPAGNQDFSRPACRLVNAR